MRLPKHVRETLSALRAEGLPAEALRRRRHFQITVNGNVAFTLHQGSKDHRPKNQVWLRNGIKKLKEVI